jgi:hypothetical protein
MEVLNVLSFAGKAALYQWEEEDDNLTSNFKVVLAADLLQTDTRALCRFQLPRFMNELHSNISRSSENTAPAMDSLTPW